MTLNVQVRSIICFIIFSIYKCLVIIIKDYNEVGISQHPNFRKLIVQENTLPRDRTTQEDTNTWEKNSECVEWMDLIMLVSIFKPTMFCKKWNCPNHNSKDSLPYIFNWPKIEDTWGVKTQHAICMMCWV